MNWISSDFHYFHKNIIRLCDRPFSSMEEMHEEMIKRVNECVFPEDTFYILGDFIWQDYELKNITDQINCKNLILILGNHDSPHPMHRKFNKAKEHFLRDGFKEVCIEKDIKIGRFGVKLNHFPYWDHNATAEYEVRYKEWRPQNNAHTFLLHGHSHSKPENKLKENSLDVGVDGNNFYPYSFDDIREIIANAS